MAISSSIFLILVRNISVSFSSNEVMLEAKSKPIDEERIIRINRILFRIF